ERAAVAPQEPVARDPAPGGQVLFGSRVATDELQDLAHAQALDHVPQGEDQLTAAPVADVEDAGRFGWRVPHQRFLTKCRCSREPRNSWPVIRHQAGTSSRQPGSVVRNSRTWPISSVATRFFTFT